VNLGWAFSHQLLLGLDLYAWTKPPQGGTLTVNLLNALGTVTFFPSASSGFFIKGGAGAAAVEFEVESPSRRISGTAGTGFGVMAGAGYDVRLGRGFSLVPEVGFRYGQVGELEVAGETQFRNWKQNIIDVTVGIAYHRTRK